MHGETMKFANCNVCIVKVFLHSYVKTLEVVFDCIGVLISP